MIARKQSIHENKLMDFFESDSALSLKSSAKSTLSKLHTVFVVFHNRSGSNLICDLMSQTGLCSGGGEFFNYDFVIHVCKRQNISNFSDYFVGLASDLSRRRPLPVMKVSPSQLAMLGEQGYLDALAKFSVIYCSRRDLLSQAVSQFLAEETKVWIRKSPTSGSHCEDQTESNYKLELDFFLKDAESIQTCFDRLIKIMAHNVREHFVSNLLWEAYPSRLLRLEYASMIKMGVKDLGDKITKFLAEAHDLIYPNVSFHTNLEKQSTELNAEISTRFVKWFGSSTEHQKFISQFGTDPLSYYRPQDYNVKLAD